MPDFAPEATILKTSPGALVCGIDEAGRGPWAGPVVAAAVILDRERLPEDLAARIDDSKRLKPGARETLLDELGPCADIGIGQASPEEIDALNILKATHLAMARAVAGLGQAPSHALVDGNRLPELPCPAQCLVKGDQLSLSIAAASIAAKVTRDRIMAALARTHPGYGWERNAGYGTKEHQVALTTLGVTAEHRKSFKPIQRLLPPRS